MLLFVFVCTERLDVTLLREVGIKLGGFTGVIVGRCECVIFDNHDRTLAALEGTIVCQELELPLFTLRGA